MSVSKHKKIFLLILLLSVVFVSGCVKGAYRPCDVDTDCRSGRCLEGYCDASALNESCKGDYDCSEGICDYGTCQLAEQGERCTDTEVCNEATFCYKEADAVSGLCVKNDFLCKTFAESFGFSAFAILIIILAVLFFFWLGIEFIFHVNVLEYGGVKLSFLGFVILAILLFLWLTKNCM
ncbi:hypothetical protein ACFLQI_02270 [Candidatus Undinarchaeota archaeon]